MYLIERVCRARAENSEVVRWDRILLPKKGEGKPLLFLPKRKSTGNQGLALREKREKRRVRYKKMITMMMKMKAKEERSKRRRK